MQIAIKTKKIKLLCSVTGVLITNLYIDVIDATKIITFKRAAQYKSFPMSKYFFTIAS